MPLQSMRIHFMNNPAKVIPIRFETTEP